MTGAGAVIHGPSRARIDKEEAGEDDPEQNELQDFQLSR